MNINITSQVATSHELLQEVNGSLQQIINDLTDDSSSSLRKRLSSLLAKYTALYQTIKEENANSNNVVSPLSKTQLETIKTHDLDAIMDEIEAESKSATASPTPKTGNFNYKSAMVETDFERRDTEKSVSINNITPLPIIAKLRQSISMESFSNLSMTGAQLQAKLVREESKCEHFEAVNQDNQDNININNTSVKGTKEVMRTFETISASNNNNYNYNYNARHATTIKATSPNINEINISIDTNKQVLIQGYRFTDSTTKEKNNLKKQIAKHQYVIFRGSTKINVSINVTEEMVPNGVNNDKDGDEKKEVEINTKNNNNNNNHNNNSHNVIENVFSSVVNVNKQKKGHKLALLRYHSVTAAPQAAHSSLTSLNKNNKEETNKKVTTKKTNDKQNNNSDKHSQQPKTTPSVMGRPESARHTFYSQNEPKIKWFNFYDGFEGVYGIAYVEKGFEAQLHQHFESETYHMLYGKGKLYVNGKIRIIDNYDGSILIGSNVVHAMTPQTDFFILLFTFSCKKSFNNIQYNWIDNFLIE